MKEKHERNYVYEWAALLEDGTAMVGYANSAEKDSATSGAEFTHMS